MVEYQRVKQDPLKVYIINPLLKVTKGTFISRLVRALLVQAHKAKRSRRKENFNHSLSINDFTLTKELSSCIDLYAVCRG